MLPFHSWILHYHYASIRLEKKRLKIIKNREKIKRTVDSLNILIVNSSIQDRNFCLPPPVAADQSTELSSSSLP